MVITAAEAQEEAKQNRLSKESRTIEKELLEIDKAIRVACLEGRTVCQYEIPYNNGKGWLVWQKVFDYLKDIGYSCCLEKDCRATDDFFVIEINW